MSPASLHDRGVPVQDPVHPSLERKFPMAMNLSSPLLSLIAPAIKQKQLRFLRNPTAMKPPRRLPVNRKKNRWLRGGRSVRLRPSTLSQLGPIKSQKLRRRRARRPLVRRKPLRRKGSFFVVELRLAAIPRFAAFLSISSSPVLLRPL